MSRSSRSGRSTGVIPMRVSSDSSTPSWPGLSRPSTTLLLLSFQDVDARHKAGHDGSEISRAGVRLQSSRVNAIRSSRRVSCPALQRQANATLNSNQLGDSPPPAGRFARAPAEMDIAARSCQINAFPDDSGRMLEHGLDTRRLYSLAS
jgi:hypothetical protein